jgi:hypothetical protein
MIIIVRDERLCIYYYDEVGKVKFDFFVDGAYERNPIWLATDSAYTSLSDLRVSTGLEIIHDDGEE